MSATEVETVTLQVDGREVVVPKGTPLVLAAAAHGVEIPIFCYEPRLGPAVGACRMCMVEVEGMPKLQAACTMTATDGMKVHTKNERAADAQKAVLEFLLINHPLDCPVCDKGGECPLQDLTFRYGPGNTRFRLPKRTYEKPVPVSPLIALDRERCILCYRCTRFSADVAQDEQLISRERGSRSIIATFEERPYASPFSGNVTELCPVGALTTTGYRFQARPWEIDNVPTVCGLCPTGCNTWATVREDQVRRVLSRDRSDLDEGWLCDKGRFAFEHVRAADRYTAPLVRGDRGLDETSWEGCGRVRRTRAAALREPLRARCHRRRRLGRAVQRGGVRLARDRRGGRRRRARRQRPALGAARALSRDDRGSGAGRRDRRSRATASRATSPACSSCASARPSSAAPG